jgi:hypothetical protein
MIKINYKDPEELESPDDISIFNIKMSDKYKKADFLEISCIGWLKIDSKRDYQDLEQLLRYLDLDSHIIAQPVKNIPDNIEINYPNGNIITEPLEYIAKLSCKSKEEAIKELMIYHSSYEENFECLKNSGCLMAKNTSVDSNLNINKNNIEDYEKIKKLLECKLKLDFTYFKPYESINFIIEDLTNKYQKTPEKIICGEINGKKIYALMINNEIVSPIGWIEKKFESDTPNKESYQDFISNNNDNSTMIDYELIDFRKIKMEKDHTN